MSVNFDQPLNEQGHALLRELFGEPAAADGKQFLFDKMPIIMQANMKALTRTAGQTAVVGVHGRGEIKTMADGTRYQVTKRGWTRL